MQALERLHAELGDQIVENKEEAKRLAMHEPAWYTKVRLGQQELTGGSVSRGRCRAHW